MKFLIISVLIMSFVFILGCSSKDEPINRLLYGVGQDYDRQQCQENPTADCGKKKNYDQYKKEREQLVKKENPTKKNPAREVALKNQALLDCPHPGDPINWVLRYCAIEYQTDDEIFLQKSDCYINALADVHSKGNACQIKEKYKRLSCKALVVKYRTRKSVTLCLEDHSLKPFFAGN